MIFLVIDFQKAHEFWDIFDKRLLIKAKHIYFFFSFYENRASEWKLDIPDWTGRLRILSQGQKCIIKLEDKNSG
jgi:hypothetical protein